MFVLASSLLVALLASGALGDGRSCAWNNKAGVCTSSCPNGDFTSHDQDSTSGGECYPLPAGVKCCTPKDNGSSNPNGNTPCTLNNVQGTCKAACPGGVLSAHNVPGAGGECGSGSLCCTPVTPFDAPTSENNGNGGGVPEPQPVDPVGSPTGPPCMLNSVNGVCTSSCPSTHDHTAWNYPGGNGACKPEPRGVLCCTQRPAGTPVGQQPVDTPADVPAGLAPCNNPQGKDGQCIDETQCTGALRAFASSEGATGCRRFPAAVKCCSEALDPSLDTGNTGSSGAGSNNGVSLAGVELIKQFEGFYANAYRDPLSGGLPITIGWGSTRKEDGSRFNLGETITRAEAERLLILQLRNSYLPPMASSIPTWNEMNINQQGAIMSFGYNLGAHFYGRSSFATISRVLRNKAQWRTAIRSALILYRNPGTNVEAGLRRRRNAEADLFLRAASNLEELEEQLADQPDETPAQLDGSVIAIVIVAIVLVLSMVAVCVFCMLTRSSGDGGIHVNNDFATARDDEAVAGYATGEYKCNQCGKSYAYAEDLAEHTAARH